MSTYTCSITDGRYLGCMPHLINAREMLAIVWVLRCAWRMGKTLSMSARREITKKHATEYGKASKKAKGVMLDQLVATTGWSRANTRRALTAAGKRKGPAKAVKRAPKEGNLWA